MKLHLDKHVQYLLRQAEDMMKLFLCCKLSMTVMYSAVLYGALLSVASALLAYCPQARGHLAAELDPLGIMYGANDETYTVRKGAPPDVVVRQHMLGKAWDHVRLSSSHMV